MNVRDVINRYHISYTKIRQGLQSYCTSCEAPANMGQAKKQLLSKNLGEWKKQVG